MGSAREAGAHLSRREYDLETPLVGLPPIANLCNTLIADALQSQASRIQFVLRDPELGNVEYEISSQWRVVAQVPHQPFGALVNRLNVMSGLDIGRVPVQEGENHVRLKGELLIFKIRTEATGAPYEQVTISGLPGMSNQRHR